MSEAKSIEELLDIVSAKLCAGNAVRAQQEHGAFPKLTMPDDWNTWDQDRRTRWLGFFNDAFDELTGGNDAS